MMNKMLVVVLVALMLSQCYSASLELSSKNQEKEKMKPVEGYSCNPDCFNYCASTYVNNVDGFSNCIKSCGC
uniref:Uncharacterized protein n=1 Tax=Panagrolaimus sp. ES5 TaxID=591445 RepID=A0AC34GX02_9BILA